MGVYHTAQLAAKQMIANGTKKGSIVLVASIASYMAIRSQMSSAYCGTKGAVRAMCPAIAAELVKYVSFLMRREVVFKWLMFEGNSSQFYISWICEDRDDCARKFKEYGEEQILIFHSSHIFLKVGKMRL